MTAWQRARSGQPVAVIGALAAPPPEQGVVDVELTAGWAGLDALGSALVGRTADPVAALRVPLATRVARQLSPPRPAVAPLASLPDGVIACLGGAERCEPAMLEIWKRWLSAPPCPVVVVAQAACALTDWVAARYGEGACVRGLEGVPTALPRDEGALRLVLAALRAGGRAAAVGDGSLETLARVERARAEGICFDERPDGLYVREAQVRALQTALHPFTQRALGIAPPTPAPASATALIALGLWEQALALDGALTRLQRGALTWALGRGIDAAEALDDPQLRLVALVDGGAPPEVLQTAVAAVPDPALASAAVDAARGRWLEAERGVERCLGGASPDRVAALRLGASLLLRGHAAGAQAAVGWARALADASAEDASDVALAGWVAAAAGREEEAIAWLGAALPGLHAAGDSDAVARSLACLAECLRPGEPVEDLIGWLEVTLPACVGSAVGVSRCREAHAALLERADATDAAVERRLRRLGLELRAARRVGSEEAG